MKLLVRSRICCAADADAAVPLLPLLLPLLLLLQAAR